MVPPPAAAAAARAAVALPRVALPRVDLPRELPLQVAASVAHHGLAAVLAGGRLLGAQAYRHTPDHAQMPMADPELTVREVRRRSAAVLPGVTVRRLLLWRYLLVWRKPDQQPGTIPR